MCVVYGKRTFCRPGHRKYLFKVDKLRIEERRVALKWRRWVLLSVWCSKGNRDFAHKVSRQPVNTKPRIRNHATSHVIFWTRWHLGRFLSAYYGFPRHYHTSNAQCSQIILSLPTLYKFGNSQRRKIVTLLSCRYGATGESIQFLGFLW